MLSPIREKKLTREFNVYDVDSNGVLEWADMERAVRNLAELSGWFEGDPRLTAFAEDRRDFWRFLTESADINFDGRIDLDEYITFYERLFLYAGDDPDAIPEWFSAMLSSTFDALDIDGDGFVGQEDYTRFLKAHGIEGLDYVTTFARLDQAGDGRIDAEAGLALFKDFYLSSAAGAPGNWLWGTF